MKSSKGRGMDDTLARWLETEGFAPPEGPGTIADVERVRATLVEAAREGRSISYSELLGDLGHRFSRPKMRAVCKTLDAIDAAAEVASEPELAVLVVRESDRLPGQGWWTSAAARHAYAGPWVGPEAASFVRSIQERAFAFWQAAGPERR